MPGVPGAVTTQRYWLTRFLMLRLLGLIYAIAFGVFLQQGPALIGHAGLLPADVFLDSVARSLGGHWAGFLALPTVFWAGISDPAMTAVGVAGLIISLAALLGFSNALSWLFLWAAYMSIAHVGQTFWGFGWENQLLETGFLAVFLCPLIDASPFPNRPPPANVIWLFRWLTFRIMLGAGLIKLRGDPCWTELTCLDFHFETQPIPSPLSPYFHALPRWALHAGVVFNHAAEVVAPWFLFWPRRGRLIAGLIIFGFQLTLIASGNLSFLNWLTLVPVLACFDDDALAKVLPPRLRLRAHKEQLTAETTRGQAVASWALCAVVAALSIPVVLNLLSRRQVMNTSHDPLELVNSYGAFGSVGQVRAELIFEGATTTGARGEAPADDAAWTPYEFKCKPGDVTRRPCWMSPWHHRLDWQVWFAAMGEPDNEPWTVHLLWKLLHNDPGALSLLAGNPFPSAPPTFIRVRRLRYHLMPPFSPAPWTREQPEEWLPPVSKGDPRLLRILEAYGWSTLQPAVP